MTYIPIIPAIIPKSREQIVALADRLSFAQELQLDVVDGVFVPTISWPYEPADEALSVKPQLDSYTLEVDLMVADPLSAATEWVIAGADMLVFHIETLSLEQFQTFAALTPVSVAVSAHGDTPLETLIAYAKDADYIQLMGIREIGAQGLPFDEDVLRKIAMLKERFPKKLISIDGSVNADTIVRLKNAGADRFVCGSAVTLQPDPEAAYYALAALIND
ncbi:hypothetical protein GW937_02290 [Candidatus Kaiserbacteria bacterium]|nr:hypothetical protein [Candidatus Kaiserbacteria bacterium]NCT02028.1 hypothetical protein [Candidatus Parcubacteria bacterium]